MSRCRKILVIILVVIAICGAILLGLDAYFSKNAKSIAHRGFGVFNKNTISAFLNSSRFDAVECDVWFTTDEVAIVSHNDLIETKNNSKIKISENNLETIKELTDDLILLEDFLKICNSNNQIAVVDVKSWVLTAGMVEFLETKIESLHSKEKTILLSYDKEVAKTLTSIIEVEVQYVFDSNVAENVTFCIANGLNACVKHTVIDKDMIRTIHEVGLKVNAWTVNDMFSKIRLGAIGVDYITSDILR